MNKLLYGLIYIEKLGEYKGVEVSLPEADRMLFTGKVGFMSRTVGWVRVDKTPAHQKDRVNQEELFFQGYRRLCALPVSKTTRKSQDV